MEATRNVTGKTTLPAGVAGTGTLTQDSQVKEVLKGTGTNFYTELGNKPKLWLWFPTLNLLLEVDEFAAKDDPFLPQAADWVRVKNAPALGTIAGVAFQVVSATLKSYRVRAIGAGSLDGVTLTAGQIVDAPISYANGEGPIITKSAHWADGSAGALMITEEF